MVDENINEADEMQYTSFCETYKIITFSMGIGMIYPNLETARRRLICIIIILLSFTPLSFMMILDMYDSWVRSDFINVIRHSTIVVPSIGTLAKVVILFHKRNTAKHIIDEIDRDYAMYNHLPSSHKTIVNRHMENNLLYAEKYWVIAVLICVLTFPVMPLILNIYNILFVSEPRIYMIHDVNKPFARPEERFDPPFYEIMFAYTVYCAMFYIVNFIGFDGFFGLCINHACLKMDLYCKAFEDAMRTNNKIQRKKNLKGVIKEQIRMYKFVDLIQETFNLWLGVVLVAIMIQICNCMYHATEGHEFDLRYIIFVFGGVLVIYMPCRYSAKLKYMALETATRLYCGGWERVYDVSARRTVLIMIMRAQRPLEITAFNIMVFDMELFVSILKTSYSMYTLLRS